MKVLKPDWPAPTWIQAFTTSREQGASSPPFGRANVAQHVGDNINTVRLNRMVLQQQFNIPSTLVWLDQTHSNIVIELKNKNTPENIEADGAWTQDIGQACVVMTADCLPLLLTDSRGTVVAAVHCGWRGIARGIIEKSLLQLRLNTNNDLIAWMGPAIGAKAYEVGAEVYRIFVDENYTYHQAFLPIFGTDKYLLDIYQLARLKLGQSGVKAIYGGDYCTVMNNDKFYSFRKEGNTGRMATVIWIN
jgi:YfiH family protein